MILFSCHLELSALSRWEQSADCILSAILWQLAWDWWCSLGGNHLLIHSQPCGKWQRYCILLLLEGWLLLYGQSSTPSQSFFLPRLEEANAATYTFLQKQSLRLQCGDPLLILHFLCVADEEVSGVGASYSSGNDSCAHHMLHGYDMGHNISNIDFFCGWVSACLLSLASQKSVPFCGVFVVPG